MCFHPVRCIFCSCLCASVGLVFEILSRSCLSFFFCSKTERPPSLSLFPGGDGMVRGGPGGARMVSSDVWHSSDLSRPVYDPGYQVWQIWLRPLKRQGRSHDNHHSLSHAHLCLLVSRSGSWVVFWWTPAGLQCPWFWFGRPFSLILWHLCLILAVWNEQMCLKKADLMNRISPTWSICQLCTHNYTSVL